MDHSKKLTMFDYITCNVRDLVQHPDFTQHAYRVALALVRITTHELETIDVSKFPSIVTKERPHA